MLAIRLKRVGRKGHAQFRVIVQDSHRSPSSGKIIEFLGSYDPHNKTASIDKEKVEKFLSNGAQPSERVARLLKSEGVKLPKWVKIDKSKKGALKNPEKLRKNQPDKPKEEKPAEEAPAEEAPKEEAPAAEAEEAPAEEPKEEPKSEEKPAEETKPEEKSEEKTEEKPKEEPEEESKEEAKPE